MEIMMPSVARSQTQQDCFSQVFGHGELNEDDDHNNHPFLVSTSNTKWSKVLEKPSSTPAFVPGVTRYSVAELLSMRAQATKHIELAYDIETALLCPRQRSTSVLRAPTSTSTIRTASTKCVPLIEPLFVPLFVPGPLHTVPEEGERKLSTEEAMDLPEREFLKTVLPDLKLDTPASNLDAKSAKKLVRGMEKWASAEGRSDLFKQAKLLVEEEQKQEKLIRDMERWEKATERSDLFKEAKQAVEQAEPVRARRKTHRAGRHRHFGRRRQVKM